MKLKLSLMFLGALLPAIGGCTHVAGVVLDERDKGAAGAIFSVGRPGGLAVYDQHVTDRAGQFDFYLFGTDADNLYLWDGSGDPNLNAHHLDRTHLSDRMRIHLRREIYDIETTAAPIK